MAPRKSHNCISVHDEESLLTLRNYELEAYATVVTALRAEGQFNERKKSILKDLREIFGISVERHKAEVRRAANDESLSKVARQIQGVSCDEDWLNEGRRIVGVMKHPLPITAYTRIADEVAESLVQEQGKLSSKDSSTSEKPTTAKTIHPPENPQHVLNNIIFGDITKLSEETVEKKPPPEKGEVYEDSSSQDFLDSYVFLPGGTVVKVEPKVKSKKTPDQTSTSKAQTKPPSPRKYTATISSGGVMPCTPDIMQYSAAAGEEKRVVQKQNPHKDASKRSFPFNQRGQQPSANASRPKVPRRREYHERPLSHQLDHLYSSSGTPKSRYLSQSLNSNWATKNTAAGEAKTKKKMQKSSSAGSKKLSRSMNAAARQTSPSDKRARITSTPHLPPNPRTLQDPKLSPSKHVNIYPKPLSAERPSYVQSHSYHSVQETFDNVQPNSIVQQNTSSPQKVFRSTMPMTSPPLEKNTALASPDLFTYSPHLLNYPVEGLAPVSAIMSQVSSKSDTTSSTNLPSTGEQHSKFKHGLIPSFRPRTEDSFFYSPTSSGISLTSHKPSEPNIVISNPSKASEVADVYEFPSTFTASVLTKSSESITTLKSTLPSILAPVSLSTSQVTASVKVVEDAASTALTTSVQPQPSIIPYKTQPEMTSSATILKPSTFGSHAPITANPVQSHVTESSTPALSQISTANIIKVTTRPLVGTKGSKIVTQLAGTRFTKAFNTGGNAKPSIIVVRKATGKTIVTAPTKVLDVEGSGKLLPKLKTVVSSVPQPLKPTTIIRSVTAKVSVRDSSTLTASSSYEQASSGGGTHKVITKGKMRQLVLKPTSASVIRPGNPDVPSIFPTLTSRPSLEVASSGANVEGTSPSPLQATSTIKALAAMQKSSSAPPLVEVLGSAVKDSIRLPNDPQSSVGNT